MKHHAKTLSIGSLARSRELDTQLDLVVDRLASVKKENKYVEWKQHPPIGPAVAARDKYRMVKSILAFANWEGGFIIFGVDPSGRWVGLKPSELISVDPAAIAELVNGCVFPEVPDINYYEFQRSSRAYALLHIPPTSGGPHVTTKPLVEKLAPGKVKQIVQKHAIYCRQGAKSDLATPQQHHQLLARRVEALRSELVRRVKEVVVPVGVPSDLGKAAGGTISVTRLTDDPAAPAVRLTREEGTTGILLHEELSEGLFEEINNVVDANSLLCRDEARFILSEEIYYRIYAERQHVDQSRERLKLLALAGLHQFYAPNLYWFLTLTPVDSADVMRRAASDMKNPQVRALMRLAVLLGPEAVEWLWSEMSTRWGRVSQPPDYFWAFGSMRERKGVDPHSLALGFGPKGVIDLPDGRQATSGSLIGEPNQSAALLTHACMAVFEGRKAMRKSSRYLDSIAYGVRIGARGAAIVAALEESGDTMPS